MDYIVRAISKNKNARLFCVDTTQTVNKAQEYHKMSATAAAALGRLLTAGVLMGKDMKNEKDRLTLHIASKGPAKSILVTANNKGEVKGYVGNVLADLPLKPNGKLDVSGIIGEGELRVIKDAGLKDPYIGRVNLVSGEIGEDLAYYFYTSEQIPSVVGLGVLVDKDLSIKSAGGFIIQLLPDAGEEFITKLEKKIKEIKSVTEFLQKGMSPEEILYDIMKDVEEIDILDKSDVKYYCDCSREKFYKGIVAIGKDEVKKILEEDGAIEVNCHFCNTKHLFREYDLKEILE